MLNKAENDIFWKMRDNSDNIQKFYSPTMGELSLDTLVDEIKAYLGQDSRRTYKIVIGTDSHATNHGTKQVEFVTAVVMHRVGAGGRYFWQKNARPKIVTLRQRIYEEVNLSLLTAQNLIGKLKAQIEQPTKELEIHVDVGENGPTKEMIKEVVGIVRGNGFNVKTKPEAYGASHVADKYT